MTWLLDWKSWDQLETQHLFALVTAGLAIIYVVHKVRQKKYRLPPGPRPLPILGNLLSLSSTSICETFTEMSKEYGEIFTFYFGFKCAVILNKTDVIREAFVKKGVVFADRPENVTSEAFGGTDTLVFGQYTPRWKIQRKIAHSALRQFATGKPLELLVQKCFANLCPLIDKENGQPFDPFPKLTLLVYNIVGSMAYGKTFEPDDPLLTTLSTEMNKFNDKLGKGILADIYPVLRHLPNPVAKAGERFTKILYESFSKTWNEHIENYDPDQLTDFVYLLISTKKEIEREEGTQGTSLLEDVHYIATLADLFIAGTDTLRLTLQWVVLFAAVYPELQRKMQKEIDDIVGRDQPVVLSHRPHLPYTEAFCTEVMRIYPITPLGIPRATSCDVDIRGYTLPKGTWVFLNIWATHRDSSEWEHPDRFIPERHLDENGSLAPKSDSFLPFSTGRRVCAGESVAKVELHLLTALLFQKYSFLPPDGVALKIESIPGGLICLTAPYKIVAKTRD